ncbi:sigma-70 family RNA polymerase sigma factor [Candidatus Contubernalis alkaliaceticus]|uniref:sigma-70 family RNA polymerase sigma factor n=1 Tax=Candidatus Contubernalis alkaliaceticus TaxID=338645 RepID=UPI001F4C5058|nr:sigma-70 family RNA polymerase sigma factor [Candidatus Contubernalis alkalaceticus]UNC92521.1 sigma-70 family RNA polymerase sigma factor [Candidatus Contubernalis alkalaceticus]
MDFEKEVMHNEDLFRKAQGGDVPSREKIVEMNMPLIKNLVKRFNFSREESEDLFQVGCIGLLKAVDRFDIGKKVKFSTYAVPVILGEIKMYLRKNSMIKASRALIVLSEQIKMKKEEFLRISGREPSLRELSEELKISREDIVMAMEVGLKPLSYDSCLVNGSTYQNDNLAATEIKEELMINRITLKSLLAGLPSVERNIIFLRFFEEKTQQEAAQKLGISQEQVSRLERKILKKLREAMNS